MYYRKIVCQVGYLLELMRKSICE